MKIFKLFFISALLVSLFACSDDDEAAPKLVVPTEYDATSYAANTVEEQALLNGLSSLSSAMKKGRDGTKLEVATLKSSYSAIEDHVNGYDALVETWFQEMANASGNTFDPAQAPSENGGVYGGHLFDENGLELEQMVEKGLFGSLLYHRASVLMSEEISPATIDKIVCLFGASPAFHNNSSDTFLAKYAARRTPSSGGLYLILKAAFLKARAAAANPTAFKAELEEALAEVRANWEKANAATAINYLYSVTATLAQTNLTDADKAGALHSYSEAVAFIYGWYYVANNDKIITNAQIETILSLLEVPVGGVPSSYKFVKEITPAQLSKLTSAIEQLKLVYGFSDAEMESFKQNWVSLENRG